jgi:hypothetical protein
MGTFILPVLRHAPNVQLILILLLDQRLALLVQVAIGVQLEQRLALLARLDALLVPLLVLQTVQHARIITLLHLLHALCAQEEKQARADLLVHAQQLILKLQEFAWTLINVPHLNFIQPFVQTVILLVLLVPRLEILIAQHVLLIMN